MRYASINLVINPTHASNSIYGFSICLTSGSCADCKRSSPNGFICPAQDRNLNTRGISQNAKTLGLDSESKMQLLYQNKGGSAGSDVPVRLCYIII